MSCYRCDPSVLLGNSLPDDITCLAADRMLVFAATGRQICAFARNKEVLFRVLMGGGVSVCGFK